MRGIFETSWWARAVAAGAALLVLAGGLASWHVAATSTTAESVAAEAARARGNAPAPAAAAPAPTKLKLLLVYVSGAVVHPGVFQLPRGARIADAIDAAGGLLPDADQGKLPNLAGRLTDGKQVKVARRGASTASASKLDINTASVEELVAVPGLDRATAQAIVDERDGYGPSTP